MARRTREEAQWDARIRREQEKEDLEAFIAAYEMATSLKLTEPERPDSGTADFVCLRSGRTVGVELTQIRRPPPAEFLERLSDYNNEMSTIDGVCELGRLLIQKSAKIPNYSQKYNILLFINCECDFRVLVHFAKRLPYEDFRQSGFREIWLGDYRGIWSGAEEIRPTGDPPKLSEVARELLPLNQHFDRISGCAK
jgi:hypothetical protein